MPEEGLINPKYCLSCQKIGEDKTDFIFHNFNEESISNTNSTILLPTIKSTSFDLIGKIFLRLKCTNVYFTLPLIETLKFLSP